METRNTAPKPTPTRSRGPKLFLVYTRRYFTSVWFNIPRDYDMSTDKRQKCPATGCRFTYDKQLIDSSDAVIFHARDVPEAGVLRELRRTVNNTAQVWLWVCSESPVNEYKATSEYDGLFNWSVTYNTNADIFRPYAWFKRLKPTEGRPPKAQNFADGRDKLVLFVNSRCVKFRIDLARELAQHVGVTVHGRCKDLVSPDAADCVHGTKECRELERRYKFYFAVENSICDDYITEKYYFNSLKAGKIPIVFGANYKKESIALPHTYINIQDFRTMKDLGDYIKYLDKNNTAYNEYFRWRYDYRVVAPDLVCELCKGLWGKAGEPNKVLVFADVWNPSTQCLKNDHDKYSVKKKTSKKN